MTVQAFKTNKVPDFSNDFSLNKKETFVFLFFCCMCMPIFTEESPQRFYGPSTLSNRAQGPVMPYNNNEAVASPETPLIVGGNQGEQTQQREMASMIQGEKQAAFADFNQRTPPGIIGSPVST